MLDIKDFNFLESQTNFDVKSFLNRVLGYWYWFVITLLITFFVAYQINIRKEKIYSMTTTVAYKEESNPFFTSNTSLIFNWGGTSDQVQTLMSTLKSRSHNEKVVKELRFYIQYLQEGKYNLEDVYGTTPFVVDANINYPQLLGKHLIIEFVTKQEFILSTQFDETSATLYNYSIDEFTTIPVNKGMFSKKFKIGEPVVLPFLNLKLKLVKNPGFYEKNKYIITFADFNSTVATYQGIEVENDSKTSAIVRLSLQGTNKPRLVDYLNGTVKYLIKSQLLSKNQFAQNTIDFIDSTLVSMERDLKNTENELRTFSKGKNIFELEEGGTKYSDKLTEYDVEKELLNRKYSYYNSLKSYLIRNSDFSKLPAPSVAGIDDPNILTNVAKLTQLSAERAELSYILKNDKKFKDFDAQMEALKRVLLENIESAKRSVNSDLVAINRKIETAENLINKLPEQQQELVKINRKYDLNKNIYNSFLEKRSEANIVKAANLSDIQFIDPAKDVGGGLIGPKTSTNYVLAFLIGVLFPLSIIFVLTILDNSINKVEDIERLTQIPVLGVIGLKYKQSNLAVFEKPKSPLAESFRGIRSSLQFLYKKQVQTGAKVLMITSSVGGEGKTFCSLNIASVFALSEKKTVVVGLDLRKPKLFQDFNLTNNEGVVNYLIGQKSLNEVIKHTHIPYLDLISSGPVPPNPSELILSEGMESLINELKQYYDYIILDTPPIGLVADALELTPFCDASIYVVRQGVTKKEMLRIVNEKHKTGVLKNISIVFNGYHNKSKYGYGYGDGYGYGYSYGAYGNGYLEIDKKETFVKTIINKIVNIYKKS
ncbi:sugar transporter [Flavobacterium covae]|uniref:non-specific protein-tyrosine kinase n=2 Tax=Flavobacterium TaxID=237 RepID=A0AA94F003_9FLAO|nr:MULTISPECIES: tyrosine-protein kinase family protein [Flavobacterium]OXA80195.1 sugar transporter [Flavobacterium columnare] [Flavobacterium columnare NBRC 100251 = ATCC 23463]MCH4829063.1 polysaccharide biosynthesis tyrosine autokinase [Flavobacterium columnare]MCH4833839.1 polysaccharide biosynthesis tyrosine autokinase [Flavobacterium columnare]MCJ1805918.1 polysaccharide biosynthesis tyrosine autokinase [Flavobacterium covae]OWP80890.1 sugar transporter [Flavobacterium covae]